MKYRVLSPLVYAGTAYNAGQKVDIIENIVAKDCIERGIIEKITENKSNKVEKKIEISEETDNKSKK